MADTVRDVMTRNPSTVEASATIQDAAQLMDREDIGAVLVVENGELQGIVTDRDIAVRAVAKGSPADASVREVCTTGLDTLSPGDSIADAVEKVRRSDVRRLPVVEGGKPVGIVALGDLAVARDPDSALADISAGAPNN
jgi:CBS domain-containing protein